MNSQNQKTYNGGSDGKAAQQFIYNDDLASLVGSYPMLLANQDYHAPELSAYNYSEAEFFSDFGTSGELPVHNNQMVELANDFGTSRELQPSPPQLLQPTRDDKKLKDDDMDNKDVNLETASAKKQLQGSTSTKRSRAEAHNISEKRRRRKLNDTMEALRELIPCCKKTDKVSTLEEAIKYFKSLQEMVQILAIKCGMAPTMTPNSSEYLSLKFAVSAFYCQPGSLPEQPTALANSDTNPLLNSHLLPIQNELQISNFNTYQPYMDAHPAQLLPSQNETVMQYSNNPGSINGFQNSVNVHYHG